jgi:hypothetical protein
MSVLSLTGYQQVAALFVQASQTMIGDSDEFGHADLAAGLDVIRYSGRSITALS